MRLGVKHVNQQSVIRADFSGGLNTAAPIEGIAENQLAQCVNMEVDHATGRLRTVGGTTDMLLFPYIYAAGWDGINGVLLIITTTRDVFAISPIYWTITGSLGRLTGALYPSFASWEDGLLIASGGALQYYNGVGLYTLNSPNARSVYIRSGRVVITDADTVRYSAVGDESDWRESSGDDSTSKFVEAGYKDGGHFLGMASLSSDIIIIKNNRHVYRLSGEYPDWSISEISRNIECSGRRSFCSVADAVFILGKNEVQVLQPTDVYGDVKPQNIASLITAKIQSLPNDAVVRYVPPLSQVWLIGSDGDVYMYDLTGNAWYQRKFNSAIIDVFSVGDEVFVIKQDRISRIDSSHFFDSGEPLTWRFQAQRLVSQHDFLLKRTQLSVIPLSTGLFYGEVRCGAVIISLPIPTHSIKIYQNRAKVRKNRVKIMLSARIKGTYSLGELVWMNYELVYHSPKKIYNPRTIVRESRNVYRSKFIDIHGSGARGGFILNSIIMDIAEV